MERRADDARPAEGLHPEHGSHDVDDSVDRPDLVQMDVGLRDPVDTGLGRHERLERRERAALHRRRQPAPPDDRSDLPEAAPRLAARAADLDVDLRAGEAAPRHPGGRERVAFEGQRPQPGA